MTLRGVHEKVKNRTRGKLAPGASIEYHRNLTTYFKTVGGAPDDIMADLIRGTVQDYEFSKLNKPFIVYSSGGEYKFLTTTIPVFVDEFIRELTK